MLFLLFRKFNLTYLLLLLYIFLQTVNERQIIIKLYLFKAIYLYKFKTV